MPLHEIVSRSAHRICNSSYKIPRYIPIVFHNLHQFIKELGKKFNSLPIVVLAENKEKYTNFDVDVVVGRYEDMLGRIKNTENSA